MTTTAPTFPAELEEMLMDTEKLSASIKSGGFKDQIAKYAENYAATKRGEDTRKQIEEQVQAGLTAWERANPETAARLGRPSFSDVASTSRNVPVSVYNPKALGAVNGYDKQFASFADFFATTWWNNQRPDALGRIERIRNDYSTTIPADGGFLVPERLRSQVLSVALEQSVMRSRATVIPMDSSKVPIPTIDVTSNATSVYGGLIAYWTEENAAMAESEAQFGRVDLECDTLTVYGEAPNQLFQDSIISFEAFLNAKLPEAVAWFEDTAFVRGNGVGQPLGLLSANSMISVAKEGGQLPDTVVWQNIVKAYSRMFPQSLGRAVWLVNSDVLPELFTMGLEVGVGGSAIFMQNGTQSPSMTLLGRPIVVTEKVNTVGDAGDIVFVDPTYYLVGDRQQMEAATSQHYKFRNNQTVFRVTERVAGMPWLQSAVTPQNSANTLSAFVQIAERA